MSSTETTAAGRRGELSAPAAVGVLTFVTVALLYFFLDKPFHIDDTLFVWTAQQIHKKPGDFYGFLLNWDGPLEPMHVITQNPPLASYYLAGAAWMGNWTERWLHTACLIPAVGTVLGTWRLARRLCNHPVLAALAVATSPVFLISSTNVMCDVLLSCFWVWSVVLWWDGIDRDSAWRLAAAAVLAGLASLTKYYGICLLPLLAMFTVVRKRPLDPRLLWLAIPIASLIGYEFLTRHLYGHGLLTGASSFARTNYLADNQALISKPIATFAFTGSCLLVLLLFLPRLFRSRLALPAFSLAIGGLAVSLQWASPECLMPSLSRPTSWDLSVQAAILIVLGLCIAALPLLDLGHAWRTRSATPPAPRDRQELADSLLLACWVLGTILFTGAINWSINGRSVLPLIPAAAILMCRRWEAVSPQRVPRLVECWPMLLAAVPALVATHADYRLAWNARDAAIVLAEYSQSHKARMWFFGHWGFQYYMEHWHTRPITAGGPPLPPGALIALPLNNAVQTSPPKSHSRGIHNLEIPASSWCATQTGVRCAGFYSDRWGAMPFVFGPELRTNAEQYRVEMSKNDVEMFQIFEVTRPLEMRVIFQNLKPR